VSEKIIRTALSIFLAGIFLFPATVFSGKKIKASTSRQDNAAKKQEKRQTFIPAEKIKADQAVAFPTDI